MKAKHRITILLFCIVSFWSAISASTSLEKRAENDQCSTGILFFTLGNALKCTNDQLSSPSFLSIPSSENNRHDQVPGTEFVLSFQTEGLYGTYKSGLNTVFTSYLDSPTWGIGIQCLISYDFDGNGSWDREELLPLFPTDAIVGSYERFHETGRSPQPFKDLKGGKIRVQFWSTYPREGTPRVRIGSENEASRIQVPYEDLRFDAFDSSPSLSPSSASSSVFSSFPIFTSTSATNSPPVSSSKSTPKPTKEDQKCVPQCADGMGCCNDQCYDLDSYSCPYDPAISQYYLCPEGLESCNRQCYDPKNYHCKSSKLVYGPSPSGQDTPAPTSSSAVPPPASSIKTSATPASTAPVIAPPVPVPIPVNPSPPIGGPSQGLPVTNAKWSTLYGTNAGEVVIPSGRSVSFDVDKLVAKSIRIQAGAALVFDSRIKKEVEIITEGIFVNGELWIGSESSPFDGKLEVTLTGTTNALIDGVNMGTKAVVIGQDGIFEAHGAKGLGNSWVRLAQTVKKGDTRIFLSESIFGTDSSKSWKTGDEIVIAGTDYSPDQSEAVRITRVVDSKTLDITPTLYYHHGTITKGVDERAEVGILTRNVVFKGTNDNQKGGHLIFIKGSRRIHLEGIECENMGQDLIGRYPIHFHLVGNHPNSWVRDVSIHRSVFRCVTIHGSHGISISDSVMFSNPGHCIYLEDGIETNNIFSRIFVAKVLEKTTGNRMGSDSGTAVSGFWITAPGNTFIDNVVSGSTGAGYWVHVRNGPRGLSKADGQYARATPNTVPLKEFRDNKASGCDHGFQIEATYFDNGNVPKNDALEAPMSAYVPLKNGNKDAEIYLDGFVAHHNRFRGLWARANVVYVRFGSFSNNMEGIQLATSGDHPSPGSVGYIEDTKVIGWTDNIGNENLINNFQMWNNDRKRSWPKNGIPMVGIAYYDGPQVIRRCTFDGWKVNPNETPHSAIGTRFHGEFQVASTNALENSNFIDVTYKVHVSDRNGDGGKAFNFRAVDSSMGTPKGIVLTDWKFYDSEGCVSDPSLGLLCPQRYGQLWVIDMKNRGGNAMTITRNEHPGTKHSDYSLTYNGFHSAGIWRYQPLVSFGASYLLTFKNNPSDSLVLQLNNGELGDQVGFAICYPPGSTIKNVNRGYSNKIGGGLLPPVGDSTGIPAVGSRDQTKNGDGYFYDQGRGLLVLTLKQRRTREDYANFCPISGCDFVHIVANVAGGSAGDCYNNAYSDSTLQISVGGWLNVRL